MDGLDTSQLGVQSLESSVVGSGGGSRGASGRTSTVSTPGVPQQFYTHLEPGKVPVRGVGAENTFFQEGGLEGRHYHVSTATTSLGSLRGAVQDLNVVRGPLAEGRQVSVWTEEQTTGRKGFGGSLLKTTTVREIRVEQFKPGWLLISLIGASEASKI